MKKAAAKKSSPGRPRNAKRGRDAVIDLEQPEAKKLPPPKKKKGITETSESKLNDLFDKYAAIKTCDEDYDYSDCIGPSGVEQLCEDVNISLEDINILVLAWHLGASKPGYFFREEWLRLPNFGITDFDTLVNRIHHLKDDIELPDNFKRLYHFTFSYIKEPESRVIPLELVCAYLKLLLPENSFTQCFIEYLVDQQKVTKNFKAMNMDQWKMWYEFATTIESDLSNYSESSAWPVLIDDFCLYYKQRFLMAVTPETDKES